MCACVCVFSTDCLLMRKWQGFRIGTSGGKYFRKSRTKGKEISQSTSPGPTADKVLALGPEVGEGLPPH